MAVDRLVRLVLRLDQSVCMGLKLSSLSLFLDPRSTCLHGCSKSKSDMILDVAIRSENLLQQLSSQLVRHSPLKSFFAQPTFSPRLKQHIDVHPISPLVRPLA